MLVQRSTRAIKFICTDFQWARLIKLIQHVLSFLVSESAARRFKSAMSINKFGFINMNACASHIVGCGAPQRERERTSETLCVWIMHLIELYYLRAILLLCEIRSASRHLMICIAYPSLCFNATRAPSRLIFAPRQTAQSIIYVGESAAKICEPISAIDNGKMVRKRKFTSMTCKLVTAI